MQLTDCSKEKKVFSIAVVASRFNENISSALLEGALKRLRELDFPEDKIHVVRVPGAVEIPLAAQRLAQLGLYEAVVCLGSVIQGETRHFDYVCDQVSSGCQQVALQNDLPVVFGILTTESQQQALDRLGGSRGHKGSDAIDVAVEMVSLLKKLS